MVTNLNPIKTAVHLLEYLTRIQDEFPVTQFRVGHLKDCVLSQAKAVLVNMFLPMEIKEHVRQRDIFGKNSLSYLEKHDSFELLETKIMDRIVKEYWDSDLDVSGSFFGQSTAYNILIRRFNSLDQDYERGNRFWVYRDVDEQARPNRYLLKAHVQSMSTRYFIELVIFLCLTLFFQYEVMEYNHDFHHLRSENLKFMADKAAGQITMEGEREQMGMMQEELERLSFELQISKDLALVSLTFPLKILFT